MHSVCASALEGASHPCIHVRVCACMHAYLPACLHVCVFMHTYVDEGMHVGAEGVLVAGHIPEVACLVGASALECVLSS